MGQPAMNESQTSQGLNRRQALTRGALAGGALVWATPLVQVVSLTAAHAESPSAPPAGGGGGQPPKQPPGQQPPGEQPPANAAPPPGAPPVQSPGPTPSPSRPQGELAFTGPGLPVVQTTAVGAALVATGVAAQAAGRHRRTELAAEGADTYAGFPAGPATDMTADHEQTAR